MIGIARVWAIAAVLACSQMSLADSGQEQEYAAGLSAYEAGNYEEALVHWRPLAQQGNTQAQFNVGFMYLKGEGVPVDKEIGNNWLLKAAELGHDKAQYNLGIAYLKGEGRPLDVEAAKKWLSKSAAQGYAQAQYALALLLMREGKKSFPEAASLFKKAAARNHVMAQLALGRLYRDGLGVEKDIGEAVKWFRKAVENKSPEAVYELAMLNPARGQSLNSKEGLANIRKAAELGYARAQYELGAAYMTGKYLEKDEKKGFQWLLKAAENNYVAAQHDVAYAYDKGLGVEKDAAKAREWYTRAAKAGYAMSQYALAQILAKDEKLTDRAEQAFQWTKKAATQGYAPAQYALGTMYAEGNGVGQDYGQAMYWYKKGIAQGDGDSMYGLANLYANGLGVAKNTKEGHKWYCRAAYAKQKWAVNMFKNKDLSVVCAGVEPVEQKKNSKQISEQ